MSLPLIEIVILNYNGAIDTIACLDSVQKITYPNYRIVVVDNASNDDSLNIICDYFNRQNPAGFSVYKSLEEANRSKKPLKATSIILAGYNGGYAFGNNIGIKHALKNKADYVLILNNDTIVSPGFLEPIVEMCEQDKQIGIAASQIFFFDEPNVFWFNGGTFIKCSGKLRHINYGDKNIGQLPVENPTFVTGCLWLVPVRIFKNIGLINEEYFMYLEDLEFSKRILDGGYKMKVSNQSIIWHKVPYGKDGELTTFTTYWRTRNWLLFMGKNIKPHCWLLWLYNGILRVVLKNLLSLRFDLLKAQYDGIISYLDLKKIQK